MLLLEVNGENEKVDSLIDGSSKTCPSYWTPESVVTTTGRTPCPKHGEIKAKFASKKPIAIANEPGREK
jgi:hypothetical protein